VGDQAVEHHRSTEQDPRRLGTPGECRPHRRCRVQRLYPGGHRVERQIGPWSVTGAAIGTATAVITAVENVLGPRGGGPPRSSHVPLRIGARPIGSLTKATRGSCTTYEHRRWSFGLLKRPLDCSRVHLVAFDLTTVDPKISSCAPARRSGWRDRSTTGCLPRCRIAWAGRQETSCHDRRGTG